MTIKASIGQIIDPFMLQDVQPQIVPGGMSNFNNLINNSQLVPGQRYEISDYSTTAPIYNTNIEFATGPTERIMVLATDVNQIAPTGYSITHGDRIDLRGDLQTFISTIEISGESGTIDSPYFTDLGDGAFSINVDGEVLGGSGYFNDDNYDGDVGITETSPGEYQLTPIIYAYAYAESGVVIDGDFTVDGNTITVTGFDLNETTTPIDQMYISIGPYGYYGVDYGILWTYDNGNIVILDSIDVEDIFNNEYMELSFMYASSTPMSGVDFTNFYNLYLNIIYQLSTTVQLRIEGRHMDDIGFHVLEDYHAVRHRRWALQATPRTAGSYDLGDLVSHNGNYFASNSNANATTPGFNNNWTYIGAAGRFYVNPISARITNQNFTYYRDEAVYDDYLMLDGQTIDTSEKINSFFSGDVVCLGSFVNTKVENPKNMSLTIREQISDTDVVKTSGVMGVCVSSDIRNCNGYVVNQTQNAIAISSNNIVLNQLFNMGEFNNNNLITGRAYLAGSTKTCNSLFFITSNNNHIQGFNSTSVLGAFFGNNIKGNVSGNTFTALQDNTVNGFLTSMTNCGLIKQTINGGMTNCTNFTYTNNTIKTIVQFQRSNINSFMKDCEIINEFWFRGTASSALNILYEFANIRSYSFWDYPSFTVNPTTYIVNNVVNRRGVQGWIINSTGTVQMRDWDFQTITATTFGSGGVNLQINFCNFDGGISSCNLQGSVARLRISEMQGCIIEAGTNDVYAKTFLTGKTILATYSNSIIEKANNSGDLIVVQYDDTGALVTTTF